MVLRSLLLAVSAVASLSACSKSEHANQQVDAGDLATEPANGPASGNDSTANGVTANDAIAGHPTGNPPPANEASPTSAMPVPGRTDVNEHIVVNQ